jgi:DNA-binding NtrC family response regulator
MSKSILIVENEDPLREFLRQAFVEYGYQVETCNTAESGLAMVKSRFYDVIVCDVLLPGMDCVEFFSKVKEETPDQVFIVVTPSASIETAKSALRAGAFDFVMKPVIKEEIGQLVRNAIRHKNLLTQNLLLKREIGKDFDFSSIIGESAVLKAIIGKVKKVVDSKCSVLLLGETGTGKELFARVIHNNSNRRDMPFIPINCSAVPENLIESELFGHVKGAFTGAIGSKKGLFAEADGGTVFLDEIGDLSASFQVKLLRVLEDQMIRPVGGNKAMKVDLRFISATNRDLKGESERGRFREDLYYRIQGMTLNIPPLRERRDDIPMLTQYYLQKYAEELQNHVKGITQEALSVICGYNWPGNVRELQNVIERAVLITDQEKIGVSDLPEGIGGAEVDDDHGRGGPEEPFISEAIDRRLSIEGYTREFILRYQGSHTEQQIADMLGITRKSLWEKRKKWGLVREGGKATGSPLPPAYRPGHP